MILLAATLPTRAPIGSDWWYLAFHRHSRHSDFIVCSFNRNCFVFIITLFTYPSSRLRSRSWVDKCRSVHHVLLFQADRARWLCHDMFILSSIRVCRDRDATVVIHGGPHVDPRQTDRDHEWRSRPRSLAQPNQPLRAGRSPRSLVAEGHRIVRPRETAWCIPTAHDHLARLSVHRARAPRAWTACDLR